MLMLTTIEQIESSQEAGRRLQERVNSLIENVSSFEDIEKLEEIRTHVLSIAEASHARFPQYQERWEGTDLGIVKTELITALGVCALVNDVTLGFRHVPRIHGMSSYWVIFSIRTFSEVSMEPFGDFRVLHSKR